MSAIDEFYRRYAASPLHVPQLERLLVAYGDPSPEAFAARFIAWDREAEHPEAARLITEILTSELRGEGSPRYASDEQLRTAITTLPAATAGGSVREHLHAVLRRTVT